jgi:hypothetical protein
MILIRYILLIIIGYLIIRSFVKFGEEGKPSADRPEAKKKNNMHSKKISKAIGEYIDYEEIKK